MSTNPLNDISRIYLEQVVESSHLETDMKKRREANEKAVEDMKKTAAYKSMAATAAKKFDEALDPVGKEDADVDNDGKKTKKDKYLLNRRQAIAQAISTQKEAKEVKRWWDDDGDGKGYEEGEVSGKFKKKKVKEAKVYDPMEDPDFDPREAEKTRGVSGKNNPKGGKPVKMKEGYSNWRQDLSEVIADTKIEKKITEKKVNNKIVINPKLDLGEAVEEMGGTLLEMVEIENFDSVFDDLSESEIFLLSDDLIEEVVEEFFYECLSEGYNIDEVENVLIESIELSASILNEAKVTLGHDTKIKSDRLEKVKSAVKKVGGAIARGAGYVAGAAVRGAKAVGREFKTGYERGRGGPSAASTEPETSTSSSSSSETGTKRPGLLGRIGSALKSGLKRVVAKGARAVSRGARNIARKVEGGSSIPAPEKPVPKAETKKPAPAPKAKAPTKKKKSDKLDSLLASVRSESVQIDEKTLSAAETKEKERIVKSMKDKAADFEKRYPGRGKEVMYATATKMAKKMAEQAMELQPKTQSEPQQPQRPDPRAAASAKRAKAKAIELKTRELATLRSTPAGTSVSSFG